LAEWEPVSLPSLQAIKESRTVAMHIARTITVEHSPTATQSPAKEYKVSSNALPSRIESERPRRKSGAKSQEKESTREHKSRPKNPLKSTAVQARTPSFARQRVLSSKDMLEWIASFLPGLELMRLLLTHRQLCVWFGDHNHRLWQNLYRSARKVGFGRRHEEFVEAMTDSWKRRYLYSLAICETCNHYNPSPEPAGVKACVWCGAQYCGFNPPQGHVRLPPVDALLERPHGFRNSKMGMCYEHCWAICWRCNDLITHAYSPQGATGPVCAICCPKGGDICEQCQEVLVLAQHRPQWEEAHREQRWFRRVLGLDDTLGSVLESESEMMEPGRFQRSRARAEESADDSTVCDPYNCS